MKIDYAILFRYVDHLGKAASVPLAEIAAFEEACPLEVVPDGFRSSIATHIKGGLANWGTGESIADLEARYEAAILNNIAAYRSHSEGEGS